jgi:ADP-heptose:LPS heptosyltransferase
LPTEKILVIKLGALGDIVQAMAPAAAIRAHHRDAKIVFLTTAPFAELALQAPYFDQVWIDERPRGPAGLLHLRNRLRAGRFDRVYDFQTRPRTALYFWLMRSAGRPEWSGTAPGASHPHRNPGRNRMHTLDRQEEQLRQAGVMAPVALPDLSWAATDISRFALSPDYVLLIPGGAAHRPEKRWPVENYAALAQRLAADGITPVVLGGPEERPLGRAIAAVAAQARDLTGATGFGDLVALARRTRRAIGNDTGPMHLAVAGGAPATVLYSAASDPALTAPRGPDVVVLRRRSLADLDVDAVAATLNLAAS